MTPAISDSTEALRRLEATLASPQIPRKAAHGCARLVEKLRRPVRVGLFGVDHQTNTRLLSAILGDSPLPDGRGWPTLEIAFGAAAATHATLGDATKLARDGLPDPDLLDMAPAFLRVEAPIEALRRMSFLCPAAGPDHDEQIAALTWAARRTDIALWCTGDPGDADDLIWSAAPEALKNHALLVRLGAGTGPANTLQGADTGFDGVFHIPRTEGAAIEPASLAPLLARLNAEIDEALCADVDAARLFLHRFGHLTDDGSAERDTDGAEADTAPETPADPPAPARSHDIIALMSEPFLFLKRRARALAETLEWGDFDTSDWATEALAHCSETVDGLRERAEDWPEDDATAIGLRKTINEACDMAVLLQIEGGAEQAEDAAMMLLQLRGEFECELAA